MAYSLKSIYNPELYGGAGGGYENTYVKSVYDAETGGMVDRPWNWGLETNSPGYQDAQWEIQHGYARPAPGTNPTSLKQARELGYFGPNLQADGADDYIKQIFDARGLNEQQALDATIKGAQAHGAKFGQNYDTASSLSGIFNDFILPAAGVEGIQQLESIPGWTRNAANLRGSRAAAVNHGGDFGSATGLGEFLSFESNEVGNILEAWKNDPERMLLGINTPAESAVWGTALGKDYDPTVDMFGGATKNDSKTAAEKGIDPTVGETAHMAARATVGGVAGGAGYGQAVGGANTANSALTNGLSSDSLTASAPTLANWLASYFANGGSATGGTTANNGIDWNNTYAMNDTGTMNDAGPQTGGFMGDEFDPNLFSGGDNNDFFTGFESGTYTSPDETGAFDMGGSQGVFDSQGNPLYSSPTSLTDYLKQAAQMAAKFGITPASALSAIIKAAGRAAPAAIGAIAANNQANSLSALSDRYMSLGEPSRARYEASFAPGFTMANDPGYMDALNQSAKATLHGLSVGGNPAGSPNAWAQSLSDLNAKSAYPALQNFRNQAAATGGYGAFNTAAPGAATGAINAQRGVYDALGAGAADIFNPPKSLAEQMAEYRRALSGSP